MEKVLIDSSIFIGIARKEHRASEAMARIGDAEVMFCDIVLAEVLAGSRNHEEYKRTLVHITRSYPILPITPETCDRFRELLAAKDWALEDVLVRDLDTLDSSSVAQPEPASAPVLRQGVRA